jgi:hypothetical protein
MNMQGSSHNVQSTQGIHFCSKWLKVMKSSPPGEGKCKAVYMSTLYPVKVYWRVEVKLHSFLTSAVDGDEW